MSREMRLQARRAFVAGVAIAGITPAAVAQPADDPAKLVALMERYANALRTNDVEALVGLYAADGVFMRENMPAAVGRESVRAAYREIFATLKVDLAFEIQEVEVSARMAWLRLTSKGKIRLLATGVETAESFNALIVFRQEQTGWKIRSYLYASNRPGTGPVR